MSDKNKTLKAPFHFSLYPPEESQTDNNMEINKQSFF